MQFGVEIDVRNLNSVQVDSVEPPSEPEPERGGRIDENQKAKFHKAEKQLEPDTNQVETENLV